MVLHPENFIHFTTGATTFVGEDATRLFAACALRVQLRLYAKTGMFASRGVTLSKMLDAVARTVGRPKSYRRSDNGVAQAMADIDAWIERQKAAIPVIVEPTR